MISVTVSDLMDSYTACMRIADIANRRKTSGVPDSICIRNDSFAEGPLIAMTELVNGLWDGGIVIESEDAANISKAALRIMGRKPIIVGANARNLEQFIMTAKLLDCVLCISSENEEELFDLVRVAETSGIKDIVLDPMMRNMKQCLEVCTDLQRLSESVPEARHTVAVRSWSGEYAMTMATVSLLIGDAVVITDDLDMDSCETLGALISSIE